jgi:hypothetical protein
MKYRAPLQYARSKQLTLARPSLSRYHPNHPPHAELTHRFDETVAEILRAGTVWEHQTGLALRHALDGAVHWRKDDPAQESVVGHLRFRSSRS